jgi:photosystem II stability/assembly factor-like uncharacterized protein
LAEFVAKMSNLDNARLAFIDGVATDAGSESLYVAAGFSGLKLEASRLLLLTGEREWMSHDVKSRIVSVHTNRSSSQLFALGRDGFVSIATGTYLSEERILDGGTGGKKIGYVSQIRVIGDEVYVCGDLHQVYRRTESGWIHIDEEILVRDPRAVGRGLNSIDGTASNDIYAVGDRGIILHYDGSHWEDMGSPTNCSLERVRCVSRDEVYICGARGTLLRGKGKEWELLGGEVMFDEDFWSVEWFQDSLYVSTSSRLLEWVDEEMRVVEGGLSYPIKGHHLSATRKSLWSIAVNDLFRFDGEQWNKVPYPANE